MEYTGNKPQYNATTVTQFVFFGFSELPNLQGFLFEMLSIMDMIFLIGNSFIIVIVRVDPALQKPMYFFLANFSFLEICYVSVTLPRILYNLWTQDRRICLLACSLQLLFFLILATTECFLLTVMSYDRYLAICNPLHYLLVMNPTKCSQMAIGSWLSGIPVQIGQTCRVFSLHFCQSNRIDHFFCDIPPILKLACGDTSVNELSVYILVMLFVAFPFMFILASYSKIIATIVKLPTATGWAKAFPICSSHLVVVVLFFGSATINYFRPKSIHSPVTDKIFSLFYKVVNLILNPLTYSLRNKDMEYTENKKQDNSSTVTQFLFLGFSALPNIQGFLFVMFTIMYMIILIGNSFIIVIVRIDPALQKPMYFFLANFSFLEICYVSVTLPRILYNLWTQDRSICLLACAIQLFFFLILATAECFLLAVMSYDRYVAICNPLHYPLVMNPTKCFQMAIGSWLSGIPVQIGQTCQVFSLHFCYSNRIDHFFCDISPILKLACGDTSMHKLSVYLVVMLFVAFPFILILTSYSKIIATILKLPTATGRAKAFSTCSSHLVVVVLFFASGIIYYWKPNSIHSVVTDEILSLFYTTVTPIFNPLIYSLRNKDVIAALRKMKHTGIKEEDNASTVTRFLLFGFSDLPNFQGFLFGMFSIVYIIILIRNSFIIVITRIDPTLHKLMYFFLTNFSFLEICYVSVTLPRVLYSIWTQDRSISLLACDTQMCFFLVLAATESILLTVMSYDRYVAICNPLHCSLVMNPAKCPLLAVGSWLGGMPFQLGQTCQIFSLHFCKSNKIDHFFCDIPPVLKLACGDISLNELYVYVVAILLAVITFILILTSYSKIIATILRLPTAQGQAKAFSTCSSHLVVVILFFVSASITYLMPKTAHPALTDKLLSLFYTIVTPMFNPMIYRLRYKDVIAALRRLLHRA
ncbi:hypothetical protein U0070_018718 [Myodes glareolus]|uniref:G-protein coupled receptors family 1 profile domain-containing protein n=1 Tax=Myodes glareolus TaxID=447135 RepID=A0AAW0H2P6_MYOGA